MFNNDVYQLYGCDQEPKNLGVRSRVLRLTFTKRSHVIRMSPQLRGLRSFLFQKSGGTFHVILRTGAVVFLFQVLFFFWGGMNHYIMACGKGCLSCHLFFNFQSYQPTNLLIPWCHGNPSRWMIHEIANQLVSWDSPCQKQRDSPCQRLFFKRQPSNTSTDLPRKVCQKWPQKSGFEPQSRLFVVLQFPGWQKNNPLGANNPFTVQLVKKFLMCFIFSKHILRDFPNFFDRHSYQQFKKSWIPKVSTPETCWWNVGAS